MRLLIAIELIIGVLFVMLFGFAEIARDLSRGSYYSSPDAEMMTMIMIVIMIVESARVPPEAGVHPPQRLEVERKRSRVSARLSSTLLRLGARRASSYG